MVDVKQGEGASKSFTESMRRILSLSPEQAASIRAETSGRGGGGASTAGSAPGCGPDRSAFGTSPGAR